MENTRTKTAKSEEALLEELRDILLREDRQSLSEVEAYITNPERFSKRVLPIIEEQLEFFKKHFPDEYRKVVDRQIEARLSTFKDDMIGHLSPVMGKMIRKYVAHQFQILKEKIDNTVKSTFTFNSVKRKVKSTFSGVDERELLLVELDNTVIEEAYVIQRDSGLLLGKASREETLDQDVIAGMLTAIKAFVEDAFKRESEDLEMIQYGTYKIFIQDYHSYYIAIALQGSLSASEKEKIMTLSLNFAERELRTLNKFTEETIKHISSKLHKYFIQKK